MRNFHSTVNTNQVIQVFMSRKPADYFVFENIIWQQFKNELPVDERRASPSEWRVICDFRRWAKALRNASKRGISASDLTNGAFSYFNLNTGANCIFVAWGGYDDFAMRNAADDLSTRGLDQAMRSRVLETWLELNYKFDIDWFVEITGQEIEDLTDSEIKTGIKQCQEYFARSSSELRKALDEAGRPLE